MVVGVAEHEQGRLALVDEAKRLEALALVREGRLYDLGHVLDERAPVFPGRYFRQTLARNPGEPLGENEVDWVWEVFTGTTQLGTHLDALSHLYAGERGYGGVTLTEIASPSGVTRLGAETIPQVVTRGWLVDVSARGLAEGGVVTLDDVAGIEPEPGDAVLFHTGWGARWDSPEDYLAGEPGPGNDVAGWLAERGVALTGCDTWSYGPVPPEDADRPFEVPQRLNVEHGVFVLENLDTSALAADGVREFCLVVTHAKLRGATGAWVSPIALV